MASNNNNGRNMQVPTVQCCINSVKNALKSLP